MQKYPVAWGLDIGHTSIKAARLARNGDAVQVQAYTIEPIVVPEGGDRDAAVVKALEHLALREEFGTTPVIAALSGRQVFSKTINIPVINPKTVARMVELEARQQIPGNFDEVEWSFHQSPGADGSSLDVVLFAVKRDVIADLVAKTKSAGLNLVGVSVSSLAVYNFVRYDQVFPDEETVIILDVGAENTDLVFYQGETVSMANLSVSGNDITRAFMKKFRVSFEEAEQLKRQVGDSRQAEKIIKVIEGTLGELTSEVQRRIGFHKQTWKEAKLDNLVISGSTFRLPGLPEYLAERMRYTINILEDLDRIQVAPGLEREHFLADLSVLGPAIGLALQGVGAAKANVNLLPGDVQIQRILSGKRWAAAAIIGMLLATYVICYQWTAAVMGENKKMDTKIAAVTSENDRNEKSTRALLADVFPNSEKLQVFASYGAQQNVTFSVLDSVLATVQRFARDSGPVGDTSKPNELGGDPGLAAIYLERLELPTLDLDKASPFKPLAVQRTLTLVVRITANNQVKQRELREKLEEALRSLPRPDAIKDAHLGTKLFRDGGVQVSNETKDNDTYVFHDPSRIDSSGNADPVKDVRRYEVSRVTYTCALGGPGVSP